MSLYALCAACGIPHEALPDNRRGCGHIRHDRRDSPAAANHQSRLLPLRAPEQRIRRTDHVRQVSVSHVRVDLRSSRLAVSQQPLDVTLLGPALHEVRRERVPQYVGGDLPPDSGTLGGLLHDAL